MRIVFFGTNEFSATILKGLIDNNFEVVAVVSQPDKINARNNKIEFSKVKKFCLENALPIYQFEKLNRDGEEVLKAYNADLFITASYGQIIKQNILDIPSLCTLNVHASLLPKYRGPAPIQWAIMNGETKTGITIMETNAGLDTGDMLLKKEIEILPEDTSSSVFEKLSTLGVECIVETLNNFKQYFSNKQKQDETQASYYPMIKKEDYQLDFNSLTYNLCNKIRALEKCYFVYSGVRYKVLFACKSNLSGNPGEILTCSGKTGLVIGTRDGAIEIVKIQPEGKQAMFAIALMNSNKFKLGDVIETVV